MARKKLAETSLPRIKLSKQLQIKKALHHFECAYMENEKKKIATRTHNNLVSVS